MIKKGDKNIDIEGAEMHNLKNVSLKIPKKKLIVITGLSGSGRLINTERMSFLRFLG